ncbi:alpha/beta hydrolase [Thalassotalea psychrophila]|uniref:Alpha/beta hydrolase n=1 Tax=Thalassotalea psychrophila TaxID=3065647 RepID=A0ABY9TUS6_9GAMM|nr:alpha/beta hydrolase [Colwelliaceae bacterium SQ149]
MKINDLDFNVVTRGTGQTLVWGHGLMANLDSENRLNIFAWDNFPHNKQLVRYDARGHGKTEPTFSADDYHWQNLATDMHLIADELGIGQFIAGGQSMGCATSIYAALNKPDNVKALILVNPPTAWETRAEQKGLYNRFARLGGLLGGRLLAKVMSKDLGRILPAWLVQEKQVNASAILAGIAQMKRRSLYYLFKGAGLTDLPSKEKIKSIAVPTLILSWEGDPSHPVSTAITLAELIPNSDLHVAKNYKDVQQWPEVLVNFLNQIDR